MAFEAASGKGQAKCSRCTGGQDTELKRLLGKAPCVLRLAEAGSLAFRQFALCALLRAKADSTLFKRKRQGKAASAPASFGDTEAYAHPRQLNEVLAGRRFVGVFRYLHKIL